MGYNDRDYYRPSGLGGFSFFPPVIKWLLILNAVVFLLQTMTSNILIGGIPAEEYLTYYFALIPLGHGFNLWQLITYQFMHGSFFHLFFNMFMLWMFGMEIENYWGAKKFLVFYLLCGAVAGLFQLILAPLFSGGIGPTIGASGAVFGVMVAFAMFFPDRYIFIYFLLPIKAKYLIVILIIFEFMSVGEMSIVAHLAHIGGALTGFIFILLDKSYNFNFDRMLSRFKKPAINKRNPFRYKSPFRKEGNVEDAEFFDIEQNEKKDLNGITQKEIDRILDKISQGGYQNLTEREKKILFEASKRDINEK